MLDHATLRTHDLEATRTFFEKVLDLKAGYRPDFSFPGYWLYADGEPLVHLIPGTGGPVDRRGETIDHVGFRLTGYVGYRRKLDALGVPYSTIELPEIRERRLFIHTPTGILLELVFREGDQYPAMPHQTQKGTSTMRDLLAAAAIAGALSTSAYADELKVDDLVVAKTIPAAHEAAEVKTAKAFYQFWNTGDEAALKAAIAPSFTDHTLPPGRPQGPEGPAFASKNFRAAVPDLGVEVHKMILAGDYVAVHMEFKGHFTGSFGKTKGQGQTIDFIATDLLKLTDGRITDNWHIEDNLTLLTQMDVAKVEQ